MAIPQNPANFHLILGGTRNACADPRRVSSAGGFLSTQTK
jgi:hypothetical protein